MKPVIASFLLVLFCAKFLYTVFWLVYFQINQREIIRLSCENKNRPALKCNGKCYLAKQLRKANFDLETRKTKQENQINLLKQLSTEGYYLPSPATKAAVVKVFNLDQHSTVPYFALCSKGFLTSCFHPPTV